ncbi:DMT family transporter [Sphingobacterium sp. MYb382]|uniref:DMT family transporter n=1 Tax=Sphingobacterium sp. MYb382 TaxID=2745278 RepID=UPI0030B58170
MKNDIIYLGLALLTGALIPIQAATNATFSKSVGHPFITGLMVFLVGLIGMLVFVIASRTALPNPKQLMSAPLSGYLGGIIVATYVIMITVLTPRLGVGASIGLIVTGQIICAVTIDHFGLFNMAVRTMSMSRSIGLVLMALGVYLVMRR